METTQWKQPIETGRGKGATFKCTPTQSPKVARKDSPKILVTAKMEIRRLSLLPFYCEIYG